MKETLTHFCDNTSVHGLHFLTRISYRWIKFFWAIVVLLGITCLTVHLIYVVNAFLNYKTTEYFYERYDGYHFPDVTVCNLNGISFSNLKMAAGKHKEVQYFLDTSNGTEDIHEGIFTPTSELYWALGDYATDVCHSLQDFVLRCRFEGRWCKPDEDFVTFQFSRFFNCYTFKTGRSTQKIITQGIAVALSLTLFLEPVDLSIPKK